MTKARRMETKGHVALGRTEMHNPYWRGSHQDINHREDIGIYGRVSQQ
jgi:hypothetical protein